VLYSLKPKCTWAMEMLKAGEIKVAEEREEYEAGEEN
jgi:hypothetical protein